MNRKGYIFWRDAFKEQSIYERLRNSRLSKYDMYYKDRVYDYNMIYGLTKDNYRNSYSKVKYKRKNRRN